MMKTFSIKGISIGILAAAIVLLICYGLMGIGGGPCNAGIGVFYSFFVLVAALGVSILLISNKSPLISVAAKTVAAILLLTMLGFFMILKYI